MGTDSSALSLPTCLIPILFTQPVQFVLFRLVVSVSSHLPYCPFPISRISFPLVHSPYFAPWAPHQIKLPLPRFLIPVSFPSQHQFCPGSSSSYVSPYPSSSQPVTSLPYSVSSLLPNQFRPFASQSPFPFPPPFLPPSPKKPWLLSPLYLNQAASFFLPGHQLGGTKSRRMLFSYSQDPDLTQPTTAQSCNCRENLAQLWAETCQCGWNPRRFSLTLASLSMCELCFFQRLIT